MTRTFITGAAGFIGTHVARRLLTEGHDVVGLDSFDETVYPAKLKLERVQANIGHASFRLHERSLSDVDELTDLLGASRPEVVVHLAAVANPRLSVTNPLEYVRANVTGTANLLEAMRRASVRRLVFASSSSVYGADQSYPWHEGLPADRPLSPYAASKRAGELLCHTYHVMASIQVYALRFFTTYGPWGRPDMMPFAVTRALIEGRRFTLFAGGAPQRDFTFVDDIAAGVVAAVQRVEGFEVINLGRGQPVAMHEFVSTLEQLTGRSASFEDAPLPPTEPLITYAAIGKARDLLGYQPTVSLHEGLERFVGWYRTYHAAQELTEPLGG